MRAFPLFFRNFLACAFQNKLAYIFHFILPIATFLVMFLILSASGSAAFAGAQAIGLVLYFTMVQAVFIVSLVLKDKEQGVMKRIQVSPVSPRVYVLGNGAAAYLVLAIQVLVFVSFVTLAFPIRTGLHFLQLLPILLVFGATSVGFSFLIVALADTSSGAMLIANLTVMFSSLMGGSLFPVEFMSAGMQWASIAFPQYWVMKAIRQVQSGSSLADSGLSLLILLLFGLLYIVIQEALRRRSWARQ